MVISRVQYPAPKAASATRIPSRTLVRFPRIDIAISIPSMLFFTRMYHRAAKDRSRCDRTSGACAREY